MICDESLDSRVACAREGGVAGNQKYKRLLSRYLWIPASAGMTKRSKDISSIKDNSSISLIFF